VGPTSTTRVATGLLAGGHAAQRLELAVLIACARGEALCALLRPRDDGAQHRRHLRQQRAHALDLPLLVPHGGATPQCHLEVHELVLRRLQPLELGRRDLHATRAEDWS
jgi:hypothetical protein